jgi:aminopeptidase YwaD
MKGGIVVAMGVLLGAGAARAQKPPLLPEQEVAALANELSGETAKKNLEGIARFHRQRGSQGFHAAAELVAERLRAYGLSDVAILQFPADGKIFYGTQRSRPAWDAELGELWEVSSGGSGETGEKSRSLATLGMTAPSKGAMPSTAGAPPVCDKEKVENGKIVFNTGCELPHQRKIASYEAEPIVLAEDSESADVTAELVDVGEGTKESDYAGKDVKGKIVLVSAQPGAVQDLAVGKFGAAGIVSYAQNQKTAWSGEDENLIRWGHLETFSENKTFAFMVSLKTARGFRERLARVEKITLHATVKAGQHTGNYEVVTAVIPGADPKLKDEEIAFSCHLDHQRPGANDNASGCATIMEVARTLQKLTADTVSGGCVNAPINTSKASMSESDKKLAESLNRDCDVLVGVGKLARPARTIRFIFPPEVEGTMALLNGKPEFAKKIRAVIHMDMVGGGPETKAVFHVTRGPMSLPSYVHDVAWVFAEWVNEESYNFAAGLKAEYPMVAPEGGKEPLRAEYSAYTMGSDHDVYQDSSFGIPAIYLNDWPDRYIHTNFDTAANIDPTKLKRAAFIGAASGFFLAGTTNEESKYRMLLSAMMVLTTSAERRKVEMYERMAKMYEEKDVLKRAYDLYEVESESLPSLEVEAAAKIDLGPSPALPADAPRDASLVFRRLTKVKGPLTVFGYDFFADRAKAAGVAEPKLLSYEGLWGAGEEYAYEVLNFADGKRRAQDIRDAVTAEYGPVPLEMVVEYLKALEKIGIVETVK